MRNVKNNRHRRPGTGGQSFIIPGPIGIAGEPTLEEWKELRDAAFDEIRKYPIPESLIQAVQHFRPHAEVAWINKQGTAKPIVRKQAKEETKEAFAKLRTRRDDLFDDSFPRTAGDALAVYLRAHLVKLRRANNAPVRVGKMLPRSTIATIAMEILDTNQLFGITPGGELIQLLRELLDVDKNKAKADRQFVARYEAAWILAQDERVPTRELARALGVNASSISRWRREPAFREMVQKKKKTIGLLKSRGLWHAESGNRPSKI
jgi:hypothetical protein